MMKEAEEMKQMCKEILSKIERMEIQNSDRDTKKREKNEERTEVGVKTDGIDRTSDANKIQEAPEAKLFAITGAKRGIGTTHHCILLANFFANQGIKIAIANFSKKGSETIGETEIPYFGNASMATLDKITYQYEIILLDMGEYETCNKNLFRRCQKKIVIVGYKEWDKDDIKNIFGIVSEKEAEQYIYIFNHTVTKEQEVIRRGMQPLKKIYFATYTPDPFDNTVLSVATNLFPEYVTNKKRSLFKARRKKNVRIRK